jgi:hypothetical protein
VSHLGFDGMHRATRQFIAFSDRQELSDINFNSFDAQ